VGGTATYHHAAGATRVGVDSTALAYSTANTLQEVLEDITSPPPATQVGDHLVSLDGATFTVVHPVTSGHGWLANCDGDLLIEGVDP
jgi:hypothetical protein